MTGLGNWILRHGLEIFVVFVCALAIPAVAQQAFTIGYNQGLLAEYGAIYERKPKYRLPVGNATLLPIDLYTYNTATPTVTISPSPTATGTATPTSTATVSPISTPTHTAAPTRTVGGKRKDYFNSTPTPSTTPTPAPKSQQ